MKEIKKIKLNKVAKYVKAILFITMIVLTYFVSIKLANYIDSLSLENLKVIVAIALATGTVYLFKKG